MSSYVLGFQEIDKTKLMAVGGKGTSLGELSSIEGIHVPEGFCVSTEAYKRTLREEPSINNLLHELSLLKVEDRDQIRQLSSELRGVIEGIAIPAEIVEEIDGFLSRLGEENAYAVRSSATAEDLPAASFAGQQDTYLNIIGKEAILKHISKCWASLFTERAVTYRLQNGFDHRQVYLAVVVQRMVYPQVSGILFTADPVTGNRKVASVDASYGLGEALVSGLVNPDIYKVRGGQVIDKQISAKKLAIHAAADGGTKEQEIDPEWRNRQVLTEEQLLELERTGRKIEERFGRPQDIEWCLVDDMFYVVQSRPITTLYPIPEADGRGNHVYLSVAHQQMMTDPMKPLGLSLFQLTAFRPMYKAAGRLFVDVTQMLTSPEGTEALLKAMGEHDPLMRDALATVVERGDFIKPVPGDKKETDAGRPAKATSSLDLQAQTEDDPAIVSELIQSSQASISELKRTIQTMSGARLFDFILEDIQQLKRAVSDPRSSGVWMAAINASLWINENVEKWLGEKNVADKLSQSVPNNITSEMGLELLDVADAIRPYPKIVDYLRHATDDGFLDQLVKFEGGQEARDAIRAYLDKYGMRCVGEIDITRTRWSEKPTTLVPLILSNIRNFEPGAGHRRFEQGRREALEKEQELLDRLEQLPDGKQKADQTKRMISVLRNFIGYREYPKYFIVSRYFLYKQALLKEAEQLLRANVIQAKEDIFYLTFEEFREAVRTKELDRQIISRRREEHKLYERLTPPRVITSDGEIISGQYKRDDLPAGAIVGLPVSAGVVEGRARVILNMEDADLEDGDILVTSFTDPSWTPLFVSVRGLVTEVGGLMTHGAVIAREYGLPAVVGVDNATRSIQDGQRIRVHGTEGYVEFL